MRGCVVVVLLLAWPLSWARAQPSPAPALSPPVAAEPPAEPPVGWSIVAGMATGLGALAVGGALTATDSKSDKEAGTYVLLTGLTLAPIVSHLVAREWKRAAIFGAIPMASLLGMVWLLEVHPQVLYEGNKDPTRIAYYVLLGFSVLSSAGGVVDSLWAAERARQRRLTLAPIVTRDQYGLALGGSW
jgi:hypothetical protein